MDAVTKKIGENISSGENLVPLTEFDAIERFSAVIENIETWRIAKAAQSTKEAAKGWKPRKDGCGAKAMPRSVALINMAAAFPEVFEWFCVEVRRIRGAHPESPQSLDRLASVLLRHIELRGKE
jgi:hypothetical protein